MRVDKIELSGDDFKLLSKRTAIKLLHKKFNLDDPTDKAVFKAVYIDALDETRYIDVLAIRLGDVLFIWPAKRENERRISYDLARVVLDKDCSNLIRTIRQYCLWIASQYGITREPIITEYFLDKLK